LARRARAGVGGAQSGVTRYSLEELASRLAARKAKPLSPLAREWALAALDAVPEGDRTEAVAALRKRLLASADGAAAP
jgi:hypothetical protein